MGSRRAIIMKPIDNVATALEDAEIGDQITAKLEQEVKTVEAKERIPFGFKVALTDIAKGEPVLKYGETIGKASTPIKKGHLVHVHNVEGSRGRGDLS
jgi:altronate dehydratase small subunit